MIWEKSLLTILAKGLTVDMTNSSTVFLIQQNIFLQMNYKIDSMVVIYSNRMKMEKVIPMEVLLLEKNNKIQ